MHQVFFVMCWCITKKVVHYEKPAPETSRLVPETTSKNHCSLRPRYFHAACVFACVLYNIPLPLFHHVKTADITNMYIMKWVCTVYRLCRSFSTLYTGMSLALDHWEVASSFSLRATSVADPGFPRRERQLPRWRSQPIIGPNFPQKLHENERNWTQVVGACIACKLQSTDSLAESHNSCW